MTDNNLSHRKALRFMRVIAGAANNTNSDKTDILDDKLRKRANDMIKVNNNLFLPTNAKKSYTITDIKADIDQIQSDVKKHILATETADELIKLLKEVAIDDVNPLTESQPKFADYYKGCNDLLQKKITPGTPIAELINDNLLQEWVRQGIDRYL